VRRVGIDIALKAAHKAAVFEDGERRGRPFAVAQTRAGIDELVRRASAGAEGPCEFVMEPTGLAWLPLAAELTRLGHKVYVPKPQKTHALRKFLAEYAKTDGIDACAAALVRHVDKDTRALVVPTATETTLKLVLKQRARLVVEAAKAKGRIQSYLVLAHPRLGEALGRAKLSEVATAFLRRRLDPFEVCARGKAELRRFWQQHARGAYDEAQLDAVWDACVATRDLYAALAAGNRLPFEYASLQLLVRQGLEHIEFLDGQIAELDEIIARCYAALDSERFLERHVPGLGPTIGAAVQVFAGDVGRFGSVKRYAAYFGLTPRTKQTGGGEPKPRQRLTKGGHNLLKQYLFLAAEVARRSDPELAAAYARAIARGKHHYSAVIIVAHKLVRRIYGLLKALAAARAAGVALPTYRLQRPDGGEALTKAEARAYVAKHFPSKAAKEAAKRAAQAAPQTRTLPHGTGSSEDATKAVAAARSEEELADRAPCGKSEDNPVTNPSNGQANISRDGT
jgi:transposase